MHPEISERERFPMLSESGRQWLHTMREDAAAPIWNWPNGEQLDEAGLEQVSLFARALQSTPVFRRDRAPDWLSSFIDFCLEEVPFYRGRSRPGSPLLSIPSCGREDLATRPWKFVPDSQSLARLIVFSSSGTTGHPAKLPTHPVTAACGVPLLEKVLTPQGVRLPRGHHQMALTNLVAYKGAYTTAIVVSYLQEAGCIRVNLRRGDWRQPEDCRTFLNRWPAPVVLGDPIAFAELERIGLESPPQVLVSSIMALSDGFARELANRFGCLVLDLYSLTEAGIVAVKTADGHAILPHDLYVEILDENDEPCPPGVRGEVTLTGGRNPFAPLLRYRTGDFAALDWFDDRPALVDLEGRRPVLFPSSGGRMVHSMEVARGLRPFPLIQFTLHQDVEGRFAFSYRGGVDREVLREVLDNLLGHPKHLAIDELPGGPSVPRKMREFSTEMVFDRRLIE